MAKFDNHTWMIEQLEISQEADHDNREKAREALEFCAKRNGQWEDIWYSAVGDKRPRYTFDLTSHIVDQVAGEFHKSDFSIDIKPKSGGNDPELAKVYDGLVRNIIEMSDGTHVFNSAGAKMVKCGLAGWRVVQKFIDDDSFEQDLAIEPLNNFTDRVWFDVNSEKQDRSDSEFAFVMQAFSERAYKEKWPKGSGQGVTNDRQHLSYFQQADKVVVGEFYYRKSFDRTLVLMSNGMVFDEDSEEYKKVKDELKDAGVVEKNRRTRKAHKVFVRQFDGADWLGKAQETVFQNIPVVPVYGNFDIQENKVIYWGLVEKLLDPQRVLNYALSREVEEGALSPRQKFIATLEQVAGHEQEWESMNTNADPFLPYNHIDGQPAPAISGGIQTNPALRGISDAMTTQITQISGLFSANMGEQANFAQSGVAIEKLQDRGSTGTAKYFSAQEVAVCYTAKLLVEAIPKTYDTPRQVRILKEDGTFDMTAINQPVIDEETGEVVSMHDLAQGKYDVTCSSGPTFQSKQEQTLAAMERMAAFIPEIFQLGGDIAAKSVDAPGMDMVADRLRELLFKSGNIPIDQMDEDEQRKAAEAAQAAQEQQQPDAMMVAAQAEMQKAQAEQAQVQLDAQKTQGELQVKAAQIQLDQQKLELEVREQELKQMEAQIKFQQQGDKTAIEQGKLQQGQQEIDIKQFLAIQQQQMAQQQAQADQITQMLEDRKTMADTLKVIKDAIGADAILGPNNMGAYIGQAQQLNQEITGTSESDGMPQVVQQQGPEPQGDGVI